MRRKRLYTEERRHGEPDPAPPDAGKGQASEDTQSSFAGPVASLVEAIRAFNADRNFHSSPFLRFSV
jgi:hypothetical protein